MNFLDNSILRNRTGEKYWHWSCSSIDQAEVWWMWLSCTSWRFVSEEWTSISLVRTVDEGNWRCVPDSSCSMVCALERLSRRLTRSTRLVQSVRKELLGSIEAIHSSTRIHYDNRWNWSSGAIVDGCLSWTERRWNAWFVSMRQTTGRLEEMLSDNQDLSTLKRQRMRGVYLTGKDFECVAVAEKVKKRSGCTTWPDRRDWSTRDDVTNFSCYWTDREREIEHAVTNRIYSMSGFEARDWWNVSHRFWSMYQSKRASLIPFFFSNQICRAKRFVLEFFKCTLLTREKDHYFAFDQWREEARTVIWIREEMNDYLWTSVRTVVGSFQRRRVTDWSVERVCNARERERRTEKRKDWNSINSFDVIMSLSIAVVVPFSSLRTLLTTKHQVSSDKLSIEREDNRSRTRQQWCFSSRM